MFILYNVAISDRKAVLLYLKPIWTMLPLNLNSILTAQPCSVRETLIQMWEMGTEHKFLKKEQKYHGRKKKTVESEDKVESKEGLWKKCKKE